MSRRKSIQDEGESSTEAEQMQDTVPMAIDSEEPPAKRRRSSEPRDVDESMTEEDTALTNGSSHHDAAITHTNGADKADSNQPDTPVVTPRKRGRPPKKTPTKSPNTTSTPTKSIPAPSFLTPLKSARPNATTPGRNAADRSARRKTARSLLEHATGDIGSDDDDAADKDEEQLAREIFGDSEGEDDDDDDEDEGTSIGDGLSEAASEAATSAAATPTKTRKPRKRAKSPTPPRDLPPHEMYFFHNKPGRAKTSDNTLAGLRLLTHDEYFEVLKTQPDPHAEDVRFLEALHAESFPQWSFELSQGFSLCLYGFGSKRGLLRQFATHIHTQQSESDTGSRIVMINGYAPTANIREILTCVNNAIDPSRKLPAGTPAAMAQNLTQHLSSMSSPPSLTLVVNSIDALPLRKTASNAQGILAHLASHPRVSLVCSADSADFPLLWDIGVRSSFNFAFHDCTTFAPFLVELDAVDEVHELLGRKAHRVNGREGVAFVLKSLPENARNLFRLLVGEVLIAMDDDVDGGDEAAGGVEYRMVYNKAVEEFVCSSEMAFRTLLKEFHDHQIITSRKDALGTELLSVPFRREELEAILEDLMS